MNPIFISSVIGLGFLGLTFGAILAIASKTFAVDVDPRIESINDALPAANCGGCGFPGCRGFAEALVKSANENNSIEGLSCPVGGNDTMAATAGILGLIAEEKEPQIAVIRCSGSFDNAPKKINYENL